MRLLPAELLPADHALGVVDRDSALGALEEADDRGHEHCDEGDDQEARRLNLAHPDLLERQDQGVRQVRDDAREDDERDAVADAALGDLLTEPHQEGGAGGQREHRHEAEAPAGLGDDVSEGGAEAARGVAVQTLEPERDAHALDDAEEHRSVAGVLVDLALARLALLTELLEGLHDHRHQRENDARRDVGHDVERKDRHLLQRTTAEQVEHAEEATGLALHDLLQHVPVHTGRGDEDTDPVDGQHPQGEEDAAPKLRDLCDVRDRAHEVAALDQVTPACTCSPAPWPKKSFGSKRFRFRPRWMPAAVRSPRSYHRRPRSSSGRTC